MEWEQRLCEAWQAFTYDVHCSIKLHNRRALYKKLMQQAAEGQTVLAVCLHHLEQGSLYIIVESFVDFNLILDRDTNPNDSLCLIGFQLADEIPEALAA